MGAVLLVFRKCSVNALQRDPNDPIMARITGLMTQL